MNRTLPVVRTWYEAGLSFSCTQCGRCCGGGPGFVFVSEEEIAAIAEHKKMPLDEFTAQHIRQIGNRRSLREMRNGDCEFLERDDFGRARCGVYAARPVQCKTWPFWKSNLESQQAWNQTAQHCPGMNTGKHYSAEQINERVRENGDLPL